MSLLPVELLIILIGSFLVGNTYGLKTWLLVLLISVVIKGFDMFGSPLNESDFSRRSMRLLIAELIVILIGSFLIGSAYGLKIGIAVFLISAAIAPKEIIHRYKS